MKLKSIEMQGFKSFPDKTRITFDNGVTAIIGPNGSGKSNISDAVRWVLGEMSMKSLRGSKMEDVIFNGTPTRPAANFSSVSITLDTTDEYDRHAQTFMELNPEEQSEENKKDAYKLHDGTEVTVTRKYYRSGESEYYINKKQVRLKDIYELFYDTGIGREGYSVISQGKISEVLSQKGHERRDIFEEAAGISKFRYKKAEAERKLAETENNLTRINDILSEVSSRIGPLEKEAENAKKYLVLSEEKKGLEITLWLDKIDKLRSDIEKNATETAGARLALDSSENTVRELDEKLDAALREGYDIGRELSETERLISEGEKNVAAVESEKALRLNDAEHYRRMARQYADDISRSERELALATDMLTGAVEVGDTLIVEQEKAQEAFTAAEAVYSACREKALIAAEKEQKANSEYTSAYEKVSGLREAYAGLRAKLEESVRARDEAEAQLLASAARITELRVALDSANAYLAEAEKNVAEATEKNDTAKNKCEINRASHKEIKDNISAINLDISALEHRRENLRRMETLFEGYSDGVKNVMSASGKELFGIVGTVSSVISTDEKYVLALETALGASAQFIITEKESDAKNAVRYLKKSSGGRATFLPIETVQGNRVNEAPFKGISGYLGIASDLVKSDERYRLVIDDLLGRTVVTENMDSATSVAAACGYKVKAVTLDGQVVNPGGSITGGSTHKKAGLFTRAMDIDRLTGEISGKQKEVDVLGEKLSLLDTEYVTLCKENEEAEAFVNTASAALNEAVRACDGARVRLEEENNHNAAIRQQSSRQEQDAEEASAAAETALLEAEALLASARTALEQASMESAKIKEKETESFEECNRVRIELFEKNSSLDRQNTHIRSLVEKKDSIVARINEVKNAVTEAEKNAQDSESLLAEYDIRKAQYIAETDKCREKHTELLASRDVSEQTAVSIRGLVKEAQNKKEEALRKFTGLESRGQNLNTDYDTVSAKLWDEYELTYTAACAYRLPDEQMGSAATRVASLRAKIRAMGHINVNAVEEYKAEKERYDFLTEQTDDLNRTRRQLDSTIEKLSRTMKDTFIDCFERINSAFGRTFAALFGGGSGRVELEDPNNPLECGIDIILRPPGKSVKSISLLSGGEQSFAAIALYLALQEINPSPFCIFDEIESALDDVNLAKFADYVREHSQATQYILITHRRGTMERADVLYGVTMYEKGVSNYLRLNVDMMEENIKKYSHS